MTELENALVNVRMAAVVRPGDTLVLALEHHISDQEHSEMRNAIREYLPKDVRVMVVSGALELAIVRSSEKVEVSTHGGDE